MPYADLHVHTTRSDGSLELAAVPAAADRADVAVVAVTDHDRLQPFDGPVSQRDGVTIVNGIELRVKTDAGQRLDLLGYGLESTTALEALVDRIQTNRKERGQAIVDNVEDRLGIDLDVTVTDGFGRPHVARAIDAHPDAEYDYEEAFEHLIGGDGPCFVARDVPSFDRGRHVLSTAGELVSLAHPLRYPDPEHALELAAELDAIELEYPYGHDVDLEPVRNAIERHDLLTTGGSDAHERTLGLAGLSRESFDLLEFQFA
ncbi:PHP domain-containing protein [Salinadaptatus halalkaliphilus]|uniref:PHP domain-containing protein n=1 Tax=Salinadaptatus halalkaliphilus TaxID=2419781 RepID=A0A4S3THP4_9EURY|nr:PHP domain-containing protein [Salinadaptatus halalkaliphilus]THE63422.1 PHP domain-containing protein [Salinadaptatus halalkaliphilus]